MTAAQDAADELLRRRAESGGGAPRLGDIPQSVVRPLSASVVMHFADIDDHLFSLITGLPHPPYDRSIMVADFGGLLVYDPCRNTPNFDRLAAAHNHRLRLQHFHGASSGDE